MLGDRFSRHIFQDTYPRSGVLRLSRCVKVEYFYRNALMYEYLLNLLD